MNMHTFARSSKLLVQAFLLVSLFAPVFAFAPVASASSVIDNWWPVDGAHISGAQPFKAMVPGLDVSQYDMYWQVDGGQLNLMQNNYTDYQHKEVPVDLSGWNWHGAGPYVITYVAKQNGNVIGQTSFSIYTGSAPATQAVQVVAAPQQPAAPSVSISSPQQNATVSGMQTLSASVSGLSNSQYDMYWQVDGGQLNAMQNNGSGKSYNIDYSGWSWKGSGPYTITVIAKQNGNEIARQSVTISVGSAPAQPAPQVTITQSTASAAQQNTTPVSGDPLSGLSFYVNPNSEAAQQASSWRSSRPSDASAMDTLAAQSTAVWLGGWNSNVQSDVHNDISAAASRGQTPVFVAYNIPNRDCGGYSSGGASNTSDYLNWIRSVAAGIGSSKAVVVLEPDSLSVTSCLSSSQMQDRLSALSQAVNILKTGSGALVYLDAGHANWIDASTMSNNLKQAGISQADGFALNVSNFTWTNDNVSYGTQVSQQTGGKHFVIDTSRNGNGPTSDAQWCNPSGRAIGQKPTAQTGNGLVDAFLWLKTPGESDGNCNGGPSAGTWWPDYALSLVQNAH